MELLQEIISTLFIILGVVFMMIAAIGILRLPDFYIRMSAITKAGTMGVGLIVVGIAVYFNELLIATKAFVIISFMLLTAPVAAHIIARAAYRQGVSFWGKNLVDELDDMLKKRDELERVAENEPANIDARIKLIDYYTGIPPVLGGSLRKAVLVASDIKDIDRAEGHRALGTVYSLDRDYVMAEQEFQSAVEESGGSGRYRYALGQFYQDIDWYDKAYAIFEDIYTSDAKEIRALFEMGKTAALSGVDLEKGEDILNRYLNLQPPPGDHYLSEASYFMALIFHKRKEFIMAREYLGKALEYDPGNSDAVNLLNIIRKK